MLKNIGNNKMTKDAQSKYDYKNQLIKALDAKADIAFYGILILSTL